MNRFCTDQRSSVTVSVMNGENENRLKFIYIYIVASRIYCELFLTRVMVCRVLRDQYCKLILNEQSSREEELKNVLNS